MLMMKCQMSPLQRNYCTAVQYPVLICCCEYFPISASKIILLIAFLTYANVCGSYFLSSLAMCFPNEEYGSVMSVEDLQAFKGFCEHDICRIFLWLRFPRIMQFFLRAGSDGEGMLASEARSCCCCGGGNCDLVGAFSVSVCLSTSEVCEDSGIAS